MNWDTIIGQFIFEMEKSDWQEITLYSLYIHSRGKRKKIDKHEEQNCSMSNGDERTREKRQKATCASIQIYMSIGDNGNECAYVWFNQHCEHPDSFFTN